MDKAGPTMILFGDRRSTAWHKAENNTSECTTPGDIIDLINTPVAWRRLCTLGGQKGQCTFFVSALRSVRRICFTYGLERWACKAVFMDTKINLAFAITAWLRPTKHSLSASKCNHSYLLFMSECWLKVQVYRGCIIFKGKNIITNHHFFTFKYRTL